MRSLTCCTCRHGDWNNKDVEFLNANQLITSKPVVYLVNLTEKAYATKKSKWLPKVLISLLCMCLYAARRPKQDFVDSTPDTCLLAAIDMAARRLIPSALLLRWHTLLYCSPAVQHLLICSCCRCSGGSRSTAGRQSSPSAAPWRPSCWTCLMTRRLCTAKRCALACVAWTPSCVMQQANELAGH